MRISRHNAACQLVHAAIQLVHPLMDIDHDRRRGPLHHSSRLRTTCRHLISLVTLARVFRQEKHAQLPVRHCERPRNLAYRGLASNGRPIHLAWQLDIHLHHVRIQTSMVADGCLKGDQPCPGLTKILHKFNSLSS
jgi:hypothetical protein